MAWIQSHDTLGGHRKVKQLARVLGISRPAVVGHLQYLWWEALNYAPDGDLSGYGAEDLADALLWDGEAQVLVDALLAVHWLDGPRDGPWVVHDWAEWASEFAKHQGQRRQSSLRANHERWHVQRQRPDPSCPLCEAEPSDRTPPGLPADSDRTPPRNHPDSLKGRKEGAEGEEGRGQEGKGIQGGGGKTAGAAQPPRRARPPRPSDEAKRLAAELKARLKARGVTDFARDWHLTSAGSADALLRADLSPGDVRALMDWVLAHAFWGPKVGHFADIRRHVAEWQQQQHLTGRARDAPARPTWLDESRAALRASRPDEEAP